MSTNKYPQAKLTCCYVAEYGYVMWPELCGTCHALWWVGPLLGGGFKGRQHNLWGTYDIYIGEPQTWWFAFNEKGPIGRWLPPLFKPPPKRYRASNPPSMAHDRDSDFLGCRSDFLASLSRYPQENTKSKCSTHQKKKNDVRTSRRDPHVPCHWNLTSRFWLETSQSLAFWQGTSRVWAPVLRKWIESPGRKARLSRKDRRLRSSVDFYGESSPPATGGAGSSAPRWSDATFRTAPGPARGKASCPPLRLRVRESQRREGPL